MFGFRKKAGFKIRRYQAHKRSFFSKFFSRKEAKPYVVYDASLNGNSPRRRFLFFNDLKVNFWKRFFWKLSYILAFLLFIGLIFVFFFTSFFVVKYINVERQDVRTESSKIKEELKSYLYRNILFISVSEINQKLRRQFPEYQIIEAERVFPSALFVKVSNYAVIARVKLSVKPQMPLTLTGAALIPNQKMPPPIEQMLVLNQEGIAEQYFDNFQNLPLLEIMTVQDFPKVQGDKLLDRKYLDLIFEAQKKLQDDLKIKSNHFLYYPEAREVHFKTEKGFTIWLDFVSPVSEQIDKLKKISNDFDWNKTPPKDHIDLRVKNRVIYE